MLWGTTTGEDANGNQSYTFAQYQDTNLNVSWDQNSWFNPLGHISIGIGNNQQLGLNPASDAQYVTHLIFDIFGCVGKTTCDALAKATVPGAILPQDPNKAVQSVSIPTTGMQATMIEDAIIRDTVSPPNYSVSGPRPACDCGTWAQQTISAGGVQSGPPAPVPQQLIRQIVQIYGGR